MPTLTISLPESLKQYIDEQVANGDYGTVSEYVRTLLREDRKHQEQERLESLLLEGLESEASEMTSDDWQVVRQTVRERHESRHRDVK